MLVLSIGFEDCVGWVGALDQGNPWPAVAATMPVTPYISFSVLTEKWRPHSGIIPFMGVSSWGSGDEFWSVMDRMSTFNLASTKDQ